MILRILGSTQRAILSFLHSAAICAALAACFAPVAVAEEPDSTRDEGAGHGHEGHSHGEGTHEEGPHEGHAHAEPVLPRAVEVRKEFRGLRYSEITATWEGEAFSPVPPYLAGFEPLEPSGPVGTFLVGSYLGGGDKYRHVLVFPATRVTYQVEADTSSRDLAVAVAAPWPRFTGAGPESVLVNVLVRVGDADSLELQVPIRPSRTFFGTSPEGSTYSLPTVLILDLPPGERVVRIGMHSKPVAFGIVAAGRPRRGEIGARSAAAPDTSASPPPR